MAHPSSDQHIGAARRRLAHLAGLSAKTEAAERKILEAAEHRLAAVMEDLAKLRPRAILDAAAGEQFQALTLERGQLSIVIAKAQAALAP